MTRELDRRRNWLTRPTTLSAAVATAVAMVVGAVAVRSGPLLTFDNGSAFINVEVNAAPAVLNGPDGKATIAGRTITAGGGSSLYPNMPAGLDPIYLNMGEFDTLVTGNGPGGLYPWEDGGWHDDYQGALTASEGIPANPTGSDSVLKVTHPGSRGAGNAQHYFYDSLSLYNGTSFGAQGWADGPTETQYTAWWFYWTQCPEHGFKGPGYWGMDVSAKTGFGANEMYLHVGPSAGCSNWGFAVQNVAAPDGETHDLPVQGVTTGPNEWHLVEVCQRAETTTGELGVTPDGQLSVIFNETDTLFYADTVGFSNVNLSGRLFNGFTWNHEQTSGDSTHVRYEGGLAIFGVAPGSNVDCVT